LTCIKAFDEHVSDKKVSIVIEGCRLQSARSEVMVSIRKILIAVDSEPVAASAADLGVELGRSLGAEVALIHVIDSSLTYGADTGISPSELIAQAQQEGKRLLAGFRQRLSPQSAILEFVVAGTPSDEIIKAAKEWSADLIVTGSHGRRGMQRVLLGSIAEGIMRHAPCPILVVRARE
jgi:nucleotide-binding universal stress UspA family protein